MLTGPGGTANVPQMRLFELIWQETSALRREAHGGRCPTATAPYGERDPDAARLDSACAAAECLDVVHDVYASVGPRLNEGLRKLRERGKLRDPIRFAHSVVTREVADMGRRWRVAHGLAAKPSRSDGVPGRIIAALTVRAEDAVAANWYETLFRMIRCYVNRRGAPGRGWPLDYWAEEKKGMDAQPRVVGSEHARREIRADIGWVLDVATEVVGAEWVYESITSPLQISSAQLSLDTIETDHGSHPMVNAPDGEVLADLACEEYTKRIRRGAEPAEATRAALTRVYGVEAEQLSDEALRRAAEWLDLDAGT